MAMAVALIVPLTIASQALMGTASGAVGRFSPVPGVTATDTSGIDPDSYSCNQPDYIDFENYPDGYNLSAATIQGIQFTTTNGYTWLVGDFATGMYNGKYPSGGYTSQGTHWAWLGPDESAGRIDFLDGPASNFSILVSGNTPVEVDAYSASNEELAVAGPITSNYDTGTMDELSISSDTANIAYVIVHDDGNYWLLDSMCTNAPGIPTAGSLLNSAATVGSGIPGDYGTTCSCGDPVNTATGEYYQTYDDLSVPGRGRSLSFSRTYSSSLDATLGPLGYGWDDNYGMHLSIDSGTGDVTIDQGDGSAVIYDPNGSGGYDGPSWDLATLAARTGGGFVYRRNTGNTYTFSAAGQLLSESDRNGNTTTLTYNGSGLLASVTDAAGRTLSMTYSSGGLMTKVTGPDGWHELFAYDSSDDLSSFTNAAGGTWQFTYDTSHRMVTSTDPMGRETSIVYNGDGQVATVTDPLDNVTSYTYTTPGDEDDTTVTDPNGNQIQFVYFDFELISVTRGYGTAEAATTSYSYDPSTLGRESVTDPNGNVSAYTYDSQGNLLSATDALGHTTSYTYNSFGEPLTTTNPSGVVTTDTYNSRGDLLSTATPLKGTSKVQRTSFAYDPSHPGDITSMTDPNCKVWRYAYDGAGDRITSTDPAGDITRTSYSALGEETSSTSPRGEVHGAKASAFTTRYTYDALGNRLTIVNPLGEVNRFHYNADGELVAETDPSGHSTTLAYDADGRLTSVRQPSGATLTRTYDADGNLIKVSEPDGGATRYTYDALDRVVTMTNPLGKKWTTTYDLDGNRLKVTDPSGRTTSYTYNADNELTGVTYSSASTHPVLYAYNTEGDRISMRDGTGTTTYSYNSLNQLTAVRNGAGRWVRYGYDLDGNVVSIEYPNGKTVTRTFDAASRLVAVRDWLGHVTRFAYDPDGDLVEESLPAAPALVDRFAFDASDHVSSILTLRGTAVVSQMTYARNGDRLITVESRTGLPEDGYTYSASNALTKDVHGLYGYNGDGDPTRIGPLSPMTVNVGDELLASGVGAAKTTYTYDAEGDRAAAHSAHPSTDTYNQAGDLVGFRQGSTIASYTYNGDGLRASKSMGSVQVPFTWDPSFGTPLLLVAGATNYLYGPDGLPFEQITGTVPTFLHHDALGSTTMLTTSSGAVAAQFSYTPFGSLASKVGTATTQMLYGGQYLDAESGLYYLRARSYDPTTGQFLSVDPEIGVTGQPYEYADDDPVNASDPTGQWFFGVCLGGGGEAVAGAGVSGQIEDCLDFGNFGWAFTTSVSGGADVGGGVGGTGSLGVTFGNASTVQELAGSSGYVGVSGDALAGGYGSFSADPTGGWSVEVGGSIGPDAHIEGGGGVGCTVVDASSAGAVGPSTCLETPPSTPQWCTTNGSESTTTTAQCSTDLPQFNWSDNGYATDACYP